MLLPLLFSASIQSGGINNKNLLDSKHETAILLPQFFAYPFLLPKAPPRGVRSLNPMKNATSLSSILGGAACVSRRAATIFLNQLLRPRVLILLACLCLSAGAQTGEWAWMGGSKTGNKSGVYGTLGKPAAGNIPGGRFGASSWTDSSGRFWLFGGDGLDADGNDRNLNDLWKYEPPTASLPVAATPTFSVAAGTYTSTETVSVSDTTSGATIYYTLDGSTPTGKSTRYTTALSIAKTTTVKAIAGATGYSNSALATAIYTILPPRTVTLTPPAH